MSPKDRRYAALSLLCSLALAVAGQFYFATRPDYLWDAVILYILAAALLVAAVRWSSPTLPSSVATPGKSAWRKMVDWLGAHPERALLLGISVTATVWVGKRASAPLSSSEGYSLLFSWGMALVAYLTAMTRFGPLIDWLRSLPERWQTRRWEWFGVLALTVGAALARLTDLEHIPYVLGGDEASLALQGLEVLWGRLTNPFVTGWLSHPTLFAYVEALGLRWAGVTITGARLLPALAGVLTVPALYLLARQLYGQWVAFLAAGFLACYHYAIHYSRLSYNNTFDPLLAVLALLALELALRKGYSGLFALSGLLLGLGQYFYIGARLVPLVVLVWLIIAIWREPDLWGRHRAGLGVLLGAFLLTGWPLFLFFARSPNDFMARTTQLGIIQSGWLARTAAETGRSQLSLLWDQVAKSALAFHFYPDPGVHYHPGIPLLDFASAVPFTLGLAYSLTRLGERRNLLMHLWFWGVLLFGSVLLENPPSSQRLVLAAIPACVFIALGLDVVTQTAAWVCRLSPLTGKAAATAAAGMLAAINIWFYFGRYTPSQVYAGYNTAVGQAMGLYLRTLGDGYRYYFLGAPRMYARFPNTTYLAPTVPGEDIAEPLAEPVPLAAPDRKPVYLLLPERLGELRWLQVTYPRGELREFRDDDGRILFAAYVPAEVTRDADP